ncbi:cupin domain-containing protein [Streptomyces sp. DSM 40750]|uniref:cupin domain-containing protein n=1 Tax=Streptomyces sp. DSM 40750 TaxID=2801030 RepID=UPI00214CECB3|nr:cupin domain-containing protein [Streptomyces sp. DSM 40750]UUU21924.1 cupin domain-containing protein [Streptomyces sp. DSM 40750]
MKAKPTVQIDTDRVVVTEWCFAPGAETGHHVHAHDYVVVPLVTGTVRVEDPAGERDVEMRAGVSYARSAGVAHNLVNVNGYEFRFVEVELR